MHLGTMSLHGLRPDAWHRCLGDDELPPVHDSATRLALALAQQRTREYHDSGHLINPVEAMAVACRDGHTTETLYSIARHAALIAGGDPDTVLQHLERDWRDYA